jgi:outer membrane beta-barrel protein
VGSRIRHFFLSNTALLLAFCLAVHGGTSLAEEPSSIGPDEVIKPEVERREISEPHIKAEDFELGVYGGLMSVEDFGTNSVLGVRLAYHLTEGLFTEAALGRTKTGKTSYERLSGAAELLTDDERTLTYYNIALGYNLLPGEVFLPGNHAYNTALYVIAGVGSTHFAGDDRFTFNAGLGFRFLAMDWLAIHADARDHVFDMDLLGETRTTHNIEITGGVSVFF